MNTRATPYRPRKTYKLIMDLAGRVPTFTVDNLSLPRAAAKTACNYLARTGELRIVTPGKIGAKGTATIYAKATP